MTREEYENESEVLPLRGPISQVPVGPGPAYDAWWEKASYEYDRRHSFFEDID